MQLEWNKQAHLSSPTKAEGLFHELLFMEYAVKNQWTILLFEVDIFQSKWNGGDEVSPLSTAFLILFHREVLKLTAFSCSNYLFLENIKTVCFVFYQSDWL